MSGFIYIWRDRKRNRYYIGSHWGSESDGYICSSNWMRDAYRRRPLDFKRRIIETVDSRQELLEAEQRWLNLVQDSEVGKRYYNLNKHVFQWRRYTDVPPNRGTKYVMSDEHKSAISASRKGKPSNFKGKPSGRKGKVGVITLEQRKKISSALRGRTRGPMSEETKKKISETKRKSRET